jgi:hypothetical protein
MMEGVNSSMTYLIDYKNFCKCHNVNATTTEKIKWSWGSSFWYKFCHFLHRWPPFKYKNTSLIIKVSLTNLFSKGIRKVSYRYKFSTSIYLFPTRLESNKIRKCPPIWKNNQKTSFPKLLYMVFLIKLKISCFIRYHFHKYLKMHLGCLWLMFWSFSLSKESHPWNTLLAHAVLSGCSMWF